MENSSALPTLRIPALLTIISISSEISDRNLFIDSDDDKSSSFLDGLRIFISSFWRISLIELPIPLDVPVISAVFVCILFLIHC